MQSRRTDPVPQLGVRYAVLQCAYCHLLWSVADDLLDAAQNEIVPYSLSRAIGESSQFPRKPFLQEIVH